MGEDHTLMDFSRLKVWKSFSLREVFGIFEGMQRGQSSRNYAIMMAFLLNGRSIVKDARAVMST